MKFYLLDPVHVGPWGWAAQAQQIKPIIFKKKETIQSGSPGREGTVTVHGLQARAHGGGDCLRCKQASLGER